MSQIHEELTIAEEMRSELLGYCYRMIGAYAEAEDAVQEIMLRVWQSKEQIRNRSALRTWIYRIATNVCIDKLRNAKRRALPMDLSDAAASISEPRENLPSSAWIGPIPDNSHDPAVVTMNKETIRLSFIAILQTLPPRQRAVLILNDVFRWPARQTAEAMDMTVSAVNSALQRARATMKQARLRSDSLRETDADVDQRLLTSYVEAFEQYDLDRLLSLFQESASLSMPPYLMWIQGQMNIMSFFLATQSHCAGSRLMPVLSNGYCPAYAQYVPAGKGESLVPWSIHVLEVQSGKIAHVHHFIDSQLFTQFGLPKNLLSDR